MPILIKSNNGKRTAKLVTNGVKEQTPNFMDDVVAALKGLTLKLEVKIVDVVQTRLDDVSNTSFSSNNSNGETGTAKLTSSSYTTDHNQQQQQPSQLHSQPQQPIPQQSHQQGPSASVQKAAQSHVTTDNIEAHLLTKTGSKTPNNPPISDSEQKISVQRQPDATKLIPTYESTSSRDIHEPAQAQPKQIEHSVKRPPFDSHIIRGTVTVGSTIETYCIAADILQNPPIAYIAYDDKKLMNLINIISNLTHDLEAAPKVNQLQIGDIVMCKSLEDNQWYRALVKAFDGENISVFYFDWGIDESLPKERLRHLTASELGLSKRPACAVKVKFVDSPDHMIADILKCETVYKLQVMAYDDDMQHYELSIIKIANSMV